MYITQDGAKFPYYFRAMSGMDIAYAIFCYPKAMYPDIGCFIEAIPDMGIFINISNDVLSWVLKSRLVYVAPTQADL